MNTPVNFERVAVLGAGVIGASWAALFQAAGLRVEVYDVGEDTERKVRTYVDRAMPALRELGMASKSDAGSLRFHRDAAAAVRGAQFVQESVPERLDLKQSVLGQIDALLAPDVPIGSSTSGLLPSDMQARLQHPGRMLVGHPFNPVYLLPLVELVAGKRTDTGVVARADAIYRDIGMQPVTVKKEIDAFIGDRLQEALWREALWLVNDGVATVEDIDDVIRYSFGLRWAQMGVFQTYRIAGGEAGMKHFLAQFGPALKWPWTKLMDVPELTEELVDKITAQSDQQAGGLSVRELERVRDENLVRTMDALSPEGHGDGWGAGALQRGLREMLRERAADQEGH